MHKFYNVWSVSALDEEGILSTEVFSNFDTVVTFLTNEFVWEDADETLEEFLGGLEKDGRRFRGCVLGQGSACVEVKRHSLHTTFG